MVQELLLNPKDVLCLHSHFKDQGLKLDNDLSNTYRA